MLKAKDLVAFAKKAYSEDWGYVGGGQGEMYTKELAEKWARSRNGHPDSYYLKDCARWFGHYVADCSGLIISAFRMLVSSKYQDQTANTLYGRCRTTGRIKTIPEIPGVIVWKNGHIGVYVGGGYAIESRGRVYGVVKTKVRYRPWTNWGKLKDVDYTEDASGGGALTPEPKFKYAGATYTNLRTKPSILGKRIGKISRGDTVTRIDKAGNWWKVKTASGIAGYCANTHLFNKA
jgi:hypothetical protein